MPFFSDMKVLVCVLTILFGMGSWIAVNAVFIELPIFVSNLPEGWNLPSYLTVVVQIANVGPLIFTVWSIIKPERSDETKFVFLIMSSGSLAIFLLAYLWKETSQIGDKDHSTALLALTFIMSVSACMSSVVFLPYMSRIKERYMAPFFVGMGLSGLVPSLISLGQGVGQTKCQNISQLNKVTNESSFILLEVYQSPTIPVKYFFFIMFTLMVVSGFAFAFLNYLPYCKTEHVNSKDSKPQQSESSEENNQDQLMEKDDKSKETTHKLCIRKNVLYLFTLVWLNALLNGVLLAVQSFACLPYGKEIYHYSVTGTKIVDPLAGFLNFFITVNSAKGIAGLTAVGSMFAAYIVVIGAMSPTPVFVETSYGGILMVIANIIVVFTLTYSKISIAALFRNEGRKALLWCGAATQAGGAIGSALMFVIVNVFKVFDRPVNVCK